MGSSLTLSMWHCIYQEATFNSSRAWLILSRLLCQHDLTRKRRIVSIASFATGISYGRLWQMKANTVYRLAWDRAMRNRYTIRLYRLLDIGPFEPPCFYNTKWHLTSSIWCTLFVAYVSSIILTCLIVVKYHNVHSGLADSVPTSAFF